MKHAICSIEILLNNPLYRGFEPTTSPSTTFQRPQRVQHVLQAREEPNDVPALAHRPSPERHLLSGEEAGPNIVSYHSLNCHNR